MENRALFLLLLLGLHHPTALAEAPDAARTASPVLFRAPARTLCLDDGLRVRTHSISAAPLARAELTIDVGDQRDLTRLAARLWLRSFTTPPPLPPPPPPEDGEEVEEPEEEIGPPPPPPPGIHQQLTALGVRTALVEGPDLLTVSMSAPPAALLPLLALHGRMLSSPLDNVTEAQLAAAKAELLAGSVDTDAGLWRAAAAAIYDTSHPYSPAPGDLSQISLADVQAFAAEALQPGRLMLTLTADFSDLDDPEATIQDALGGVLPTPPEATPDEAAPAEEPPADGEEAEAPAAGPALRVVIQDDSCITPLSGAGGAPDLPALKALSIPASVSGPEAMVVWPLPAAYTDDDLMWEMFPVIAEEFLHRTLEKKQMSAQLPTDVVSCTWLPGSQASALACRVPVGRDGDQGKVARWITTANDVLWYPDAQNKLREVFPQLKERLRGRMLLRAADGADGEVDALTWASTYDRISGEAYPHLSRMSALDDLDPKKVLEAYREWMNPERFAVVSLVPDGNTPDIAADVLRSDLALSAPWAPVPPPWEAPPPPPPPEEGEEAEEEEEEEEEVEEVAEETPLLTASELAAMADNPMLAGTVRETLPNGMTLVIVERPGFPVARATLVHQGGVLREPERGIDEMAWLTASPFSANAAPFVPAWPLEGQASWHRERLPGAWVQGLTGPVGNLEGLLYILHEAVRAPAADPLLAKDYTYFTGRRYRPTGWQALRLASYDAFFGPDAAASLPYVSKKERKALTIEAADAWAKQVISPKATTLVVISPLPAGEIRAAVTETFSGWSGGSAPAAPARSSATPRQGVLLMAGPGPLAEAQIRCPVGSAEDDDPAARVLLADMLELSVWETTRDSPPVNFAVNIEEMGGGVAWLRASYEAPIANAGDTISVYRGVLAQTLADLDESIARDALEVLRTSLLEQVTAALDVKPRPRRKERERLAGIIEAIEALDTLEEPSEATRPLLDELIRIVEAGEAIPEPEEEDAAEVEDEDAVVEIEYEAPPRPTLDDARARRAALFATAYGTPGTMLEQLIAESAVQRAGTSPTSLANGLVAVDKIALRTQLAACVGHDLASIYGPAELIAPSLERAGVTFENLDPKAYKKR